MESMLFRKSIFSQFIGMHSITLMLCRYRKKRSKPSQASENHSRERKTMTASILKKSTLIETIHALSAEEALIEQADLVAGRARFAAYTGTRRENYDLMTAETPIASGVTMQQVLATSNPEGVAGWWVRPLAAPGDRAILLIHGGGFCLGSAHGYRGFASQIAVRTQCAVFVADYPLAPEHPYPAAIDATAVACRWLATQGIKQMALTGDSAGGCLALAVLAEDLRVAPRVCAVTVFSPVTDLAMTGASHHDPATQDAIFQPAMLAALEQAYVGDADPKGRISPLYHVPAVLPPILIQVARDELLLDDARRYAIAAAERGGEVRLDIYEGLHHVFQRATATLPSARRAFDDAASFFVRHWGKAE
jgi:monoterpene epsilon-lactone hydrolase